MSVLKQKRTTSKAEFINTANQIYVETINFLTRLSARYSRLIAEPVAKLAGEIIDHAEKANSNNANNSGGLRPGFCKYTRSNVVTETRLWASGEG